MSSETILRVVQDCLALLLEMLGMSEPPVWTAGGGQGALFVGHVREGSRKPEQREEGVRPAV